MARPRGRVCLQDGLKLNLNILLRRNMVVRGGVCSATIQWNHSYWGVVAEGKLSSDLSDERHGWLRIQVGNLDQRVHLVGRSRRFGGFQWYFICPSTGRDCSVLWKPPGALRFSSRETWGRQVAYHSQYIGKIDRAHYGQAKIRGRLIGELDPDEWDLPPKPRRMRWKTYERYTAKFDRYENWLDFGCAALVAKLGKKFF